MVGPPRCSWPPSGSSASCPTRSSCASREIGIRVALGAYPADVLRMVLGQALLLAVPGHEVRPHDPLTFVTVPLLLLGIALAASYLPARRAARVDPIAALRAA